jgi:hypothetical protein
MQTYQEFFILSILDYVSSSEVSGELHALSVLPHPPSIKEPPVPIGQAVGWGLELV